MFKFIFKELWFIKATLLIVGISVHSVMTKKKGKRKVQGVSQSQSAALPRNQEAEETDKTKQAQIEQTYENH